MIPDSAIKVSGIQLSMRTARSLRMEGVRTIPAGFSSEPAAGTAQAGWLGIATLSAPEFVTPAGW